MVWSRALSRTRIALAVAGLGVAAVAVVATTALAQPSEPNAAPALPGPNQFVSGLDLECYSTPGPALNIGLVLSHLNPVLQAMGLPPHEVVIGALVQTCVPVMKNGVVPQAAALPFIQHVDFACYKISTSPLATPVTLNLTHLNPVLSSLPVHNVQLTQATQLCLPVAKNGVMPPANVLQLVEFLDLECYTANPITAHPTFGVTVGQLNPQLTSIPAHPLTLVNQPRQLCVPVQKGQQVIPSNVLSVVEWTDVEQFAASPPVTITPVSVKLNHLNPMFTSQPSVGVTLQQAIGLMVPVAKNGMFPPPP